MRNGEMMLVAFAICQIIVLYVLMFTENWDYFVFDLFACLLKTVEIILFALLYMFAKN
jgi:hypothetical protein